MGDGVKISKDKRHRSCCSVAAPAGIVRSDRRLDARASIAEVNDKFCDADSRCDLLQQKINMIKYFKRKKKKLKKRSTRVQASEAADISPVISVHTKPRISRCFSTSTARAGGRGAAAGLRGATTANSTAQNNREAVRAARGPASAAPATRRPPAELRRHADGDAAASDRGVESVCGAEHARQRRLPPPADPGDARAARYAVNRVTDVMELDLHAALPRAARDEVGAAGPRGIKHTSAKEPHRRDQNNNMVSVVVVGSGEGGDQVAVVGRAAAPRRPRAPHYETPTAASRMRRVPHPAAPRRRLPFVVSATVAPSHNLAVNLQKLLNSLKIRQPPRGIPPTLAHHLGLHNPPTNNVSSSALVAGRGGACAGRSFARALARLRSGDGPLPRYLRSLHLISSKREDVYDWDTSDYNTGEEKFKLAEYAQLCRELERVDERLGVRLAARRDPALELRRRQLVALLKAREGKVSDIVSKYRDEPASSVRLSASSTERWLYRHSQLKLNVG